MSTFCVAAVTEAQPTTPNCRALVEDVARLECYDGLFGPPTSTAHESAAVAGSQSASAVDQREQRAQELQYDWLALTPHRPNYILPFTYLNNADFSPYAEIGNIDEIEDVEVKYQLSARTVLWPRMFGSRLDTWFAFTLQSYWQLYASDISAPFRETNYEPELFVSMPVHADVFGWRLHSVSVGVVHQSNGRSEPLSRSWNRITGQLLFEKGDAAFFARAWWRIPEDVGQDDNPDIEDYMGQGEVGGAYRAGNHTFALLIKNNFSSDNKSGVQLDWSFPLFRHLKGYLQLYSGYGENLIDGPNYQNRVGVGFMLTDWL